MTHSRRCQLEPQETRSEAGLRTFANERLKPVFPLLVATVSALALTCHGQSQVARYKQHVAQGLELHKQGRYAEAAAAYDIALREVERQLGPDDLAAAEVLVYIGCLHSAQQEYAAAQAAFERALAITEKARAPEDAWLGLVLTNLALAQQKQGYNGRAELVYRRALAILLKTLGPGDLYTAVAELGMAKLLVGQRRNTEAEPLFEAAIPVLETKAADDPNLVIAIINLAEAYRIDGLYAKAEPFYRRALAIVTQSPTFQTDEVSQGLRHFPEMLRKMKRKSEARDLDAQLKAILPR